MHPLPLQDSYSNYAASAIAAKTLMRSEAGAAVPLFVNQVRKEYLLYALG